MKKLLGHLFISAVFPVLFIKHLIISFTFILCVKIKGNPKQKK